MKRKKWSELEEQTLLSKYSELLRSGTLPKLKTREKKFKPIADHVNAVHHLRDSTTFPFKWSWRDVSIKVQNMRHQYLGVKQKIRLSPHQFNWKDGTNHWENFLNYKEVFGDVQLDPKPNRNRELGFEIDDDDDDDDDDGDHEHDDDDGCMEEHEVLESVLKLREVVVKREEKRREREFRKEKVDFEGERERKRKEREWEWLEEEESELELELEERQLRFAKREFEKRVRLERELEEERRRRKKVEEKMEEEELEWRHKMVEMQVEHEKQMMQMHAEACHNQMQILGIMARILCQFFGSGTDGLGTTGLGALPPQVLHHSGGLGNVKPDANSPSEFI